MLLIQAANRVVLSATRAGRAYARNHGAPFRYDSNEATALVMCAIESLGLPECEQPVTDCFYRIYAGLMEIYSSAELEGLRHDA